MKKDPRGTMFHVEQKMKEGFKMKKYRVHIIRKVYYPYTYETYYFIGKLEEAQKWCESNRDASKEIYCNIEGTQTLSEYRIKELKERVENVIDRR